jgi:hypothetical protein
MARTKKMALYIASEGSNFGGDPSGSGANYLPLWCTMIALRQDAQAAIETNYMTGRNWDTPAIAGPDGGSFDFEIPLCGYATGGVAAASPPTADALDVLIAHIMGNQLVRVGGDVSSGTTPNTLVVASDVYNAGELVPVWEAGLPSTANGGPRTQWHQIISDAGTGTYTVAPSLVQNITTAAVGYATRQWWADDDGGDSAAFVLIEDDRQMTFLGCRVTAASIVCEDAARSLIKLRASVAYDTRTITTKGSLPAVLGAPPAPPLVPALSPVWFNGTRIAMPSWELDFGITNAEIRTTENVTGRANNELIVMKPVFKGSPILTTALEDLKRNASTGQLLVQMGAGVLTSGRLNTMAACFDLAQVREAAPTDENGRLRTALEFRAMDPVVVGATAVPARVFHLARA